MRAVSKDAPRLSSPLPNDGAKLELLYARAFRNVLIHGYAAIEHDRVWHIAEASLPGLRAAVVALLDELSPHQDET